MSPCSKSRTSDHRLADLRRRSGDACFESCWGVWLSVAWMTGYLPERMLSFDNLFVFHMIFSVYGTPSYLKHRPP